MKKLFFAVSLAILSVNAFAQDETPTHVNNQNRTGSMPFSSSIGTEVEHVDLGSGSLSVRVPIVSTPGRGINAYLKLRYDSAYWVASQRVNQYGNGYYIWNVVKNNGWQISSPIVTVVGKAVTCQNSSQGTAHWNMNRIYVDSDGGQHPLAQQTASGGLCVGPGDPTGPDLTSQGMSVNSAGAYLLADGSQEQSEDSNGNQITSTDTLGRTLYTKSTTTGSNGSPIDTYSYIDPNGQTQNVVVTWEQISRGPTAFGTTTVDYGTIQESPNGLRTVIQSIALPNGRQYQFTYESTFGGISRIDLPTGGYITYAYSVYQADTKTRLYVSNRTEHIGTQTNSWSISLAPLTGYPDDPVVSTVTDPLGNQSQFTSEPGAVYLAKIYSGTIASGTLLRQYQIDYLTNSSDPFYDPSYDPTIFPYEGQPGVGPLPIRITTTLENGLVSKKEFDYDSFTYTFHPYHDGSTIDNSTAQTYTGSRGNVLEMREYDWASGASGPLLRRTRNCYLHDSNSAYLNANIVSKIRTIQVYSGNATPSVNCASDSGNQAAYTELEFDSTSIGTTSGAPQHDYSNYSSSNSIRGNVTKVKRWRNTDNSLVSTTYNYDDLGNITSISDPLGHITSYDYTDNFSDGVNRNSHAYVTTVTLPNTGAAHVYRKQYDWNTGLLVTHCGQNYPSASACVYTASPTQADFTTLTYDLMKRPLVTKTGAGAITSLSYNSDPVPPKTTKSVLSSGSSYIVSSVQADEFGRSIQTSLDSDPQGIVKTDTTYDALGRTSTVSNPYRASDTVYVTTTKYDALGRIVKLIPTDGTDTANNVVTSYAGTSTTVTDEAGKVRRSSIDGLGRLVEVDEPTEVMTGGSPEVPPTASTGSVSISGSLQSIPDPNSPATSGSVTLTLTGSERTAQVQTQAATTASGSFTITGSEQRISQTDCPYPQTTCYLYDGGSVSVVVGSYTFTVNYGQGSTTTSIANGLRSAMSGNPTFTAGGTGATISITTITTGTAANYSISGGSIYDQGDFTHASFGVTPSGATLTGGANPAYSTIYDPGTVTVTANGFSKSVNYGQGSTTSTIAAALASAFNGDPSSPVTASSSGAGLTLTSKATGTGSNYSDSFTSATTDTTHFSGASFSVTGASSLSGGLNQGTLYDSGSVTVTVGTASATANFSGSSTTPSKIASSLASSLNSSSTVSATASGATVNLTSKSTGSATNYSISYSGTYDTVHFASASFSESKSGMSGGADDIPAVPPTGTGIWNLNSPAVSNYTYDILGNLTCVEQHGGVTGTGCSSLPSQDSTSPWRVRRFTYNSLSQLLTANNPESGAISYAYNNDGVVTSKTDARGFTITYSPTESPTDALHRVTKKTYSNGDAAVTYSYDSGANGLGRRTGMTDASGSTSWTYDGAGRETQEQRTIAGVTKTIVHSYNADDSLATLTYPSGNVITYAVNTAGQQLSAVDTAGVNYAKSAMYSAGGGLTSAIYGYTSSFAGITTTNSYNSRLQPAILSAAAPTGTIFSLSFDYGSGTANNGNVLQITDNRDNTRSQAFTYDGLNRLLTAQTSNSNAWGNSYQYDAWGNLNKMLAIPNSGKPEGQHFDQMSDITNRLIGYSYDAAGNMTTGVTGYDAEGRVTAAGGVTYTYDGEGARVQKSGGTLYWGSGPLAESDPSANITKEFIFFDGKRIAVRKASGEIDYLFADHLGSARFTSNSTGTQLLDDQDFLPYGSIASGSSSSGNNYKFTGKERDQESGNDYFEARYYSSAMARFLIPDWSAKVEPVPYAKLDNPQSLNLYTYVLNNPLSNIDADGHACSGALGNTGSGFCTRATEYGKFDSNPRIQSQTRFFAAANAVSQGLANVAAWSPVVRMNGVSAQTASFLEGVGQKLEKLNQVEASAIQNGSLKGPNLDQQLVHNEQNAVQAQLDSLKQSDPNAYNKTVTEINGALNPSAAGTAESYVFSTDRAFQGVLDGVRNDLGRDIDFSKQSDREAIGNALIQNVRQTGGCALNGSKQPGC